MSTAIAKFVKEMFPTLTKSITSTVYKLHPHAMSVQMFNNSKSNRFKLQTVVSDEIGALEITLCDREVRTMLGKNVFEVDTQASNFIT